MTILVDIGSTVLKVAELDQSSQVCNYRFHNRDYEAGVYSQVSSLLEGYRAADPTAKFRICSSANGGILVGVVCLTSRFSGNVARNLAMAAGGNVIFTDVLGESEPTQAKTDVIVLAGGTDCEDTPHMQEQIAKFSANRYQFQTLIYAGNSCYAGKFQKRHPNAIVVPNPLGDNLANGSEDLLGKIRDLYLDDLIEKDGVSDLQTYSEVPIWPTPAIVNIASDHIARNGMALQFPAPCVVIDIGGATTDVHFGIEVVRTGNADRLDGFRTHNRHVFTDLGVFASRESAIARLAESDRLFEFFRVLHGPNASRVYAEFREGTADDDLLFYACFFMAFDSLTRTGDSLSPNINIAKINSIVVTGGASQRVDADVLSRITLLFLDHDRDSGIQVFLDSKYSLWLDGMKRLPSLLNGSNGNS